jgi:hypothetical protein
VTRHRGAAVAGYVPRGACDVAATAAWLRGLPAGVRADVRYAPGTTVLVAAPEAHLLDGAEPPWPVDRLTGDEVRDALLLPAPHPRGLVELVKTVTTAVPARPDAGGRPYVLPASVPPATSGGVAPGTALTSLPEPVVLAVGVLPVALPAAVVDRVRAEAQRHAYLARPAVLRDSGDLYRGAKRAEAEPFAMEAATAWASMARDYREWRGRVRISFVSAAPLDDITIDRVASALTPGHRWYDALRPESGEVEAFVSSVDTLGAGGWSSRETGDPVLRALAVVASADEAAATLGLHRGGGSEAPHVRAMRALVAAAEELARLPRSDAGEEALRDVLRVGLAAALPGSTYAEAMQGHGRTDLIVRVDNRNVLVAECKLWHRPGTLPKAIPQLLGYLTAADRHAALVVFARGTDPAAVTAAARAALRADPAYVRASGGDAVLRTQWGTEVSVALVVVALPA